MTALDHIRAGNYTPIELLRTADLLRGFGHRDMADLCRYEAECVQVVGMWRERSDYRINARATSCRDRPRAWRTSQVDIGDPRD